MKLEASIELNLKTEEVTKAVLEASRLAMRDTVVEVAYDSIHGSPKKTGNNMRSIAGEVSGMGKVADGGEGSEERVVDDSKIEGAVYSTSGYGGYLEVGTSPHIITVKNAKVLTDGKIFFGKTVHHPGTAPHPYFYPALIKYFTKEKFAASVKEHLK